MREITEIKLILKQLKNTTKQKWNNHCNGLLKNINVHLNRNYTT